MAPPSLTLGRPPPVGSHHLPEGGGSGPRLDVPGDVPCRGGPSRIWFSSSPTQHRTTTHPVSFPPCVLAGFGSTQKRFVGHFARRFPVPVHRYKDHHRPLRNTSMRPICIPSVMFRVSTPWVWVTGDRGSGRPGPGSPTPNSPHSPVWAQAIRFFPTLGNRAKQCAGRSRSGSGGGVRLI